MSLLDHAKKLLLENQIMVVFFAIVFGLITPKLFLPFSGYTTELLMSVFFFSSLRLSIHEMLDYARDWRMMTIANVFKLVIIPLAISIPFLYLAPDWGLALLIVGAVPTGMTIALIADFFGGKTSLALLLSAMTSLLAPLTVPLIFWVALGQSVELPLFSMFKSLFLTIVVPFTVASIIKHYKPKPIEAHDAWWRRLSLIAFGLLVAAIVAGSTSKTTLSFSWTDLVYLVLSFVWLGAIVWSAYQALSSKRLSDRVTVVLGLVYINNTLALYIANTFFADQNVLPKIILFLLAMNFLLPPIKLKAREFNQHILNI